MFSVKRTHTGYKDGDDDDDDDDEMFLWYGWPLKGV